MIFNSVYGNLDAKHQGVLVTWIVLAYKYLTVLMIKDGRFFSKVLEHFIMRIFNINFLYFSVKYQDIES